MKRVLVTLLAVAPLAACVGPLHAHVADTRLPAAFEAPAGQPLPAAALDRWWTLYGDAELTRLIDEAMAKSPDARTAAARIEEVRAQRRANLARAYPTGSLVGNAQTGSSTVLAGDLLNFPGFSNSGMSQSYGLNFDVSWELDLFGAVKAGRRGIDADYAASRFNIEGTRASLVAGVADSLFATRGLALQLADAQETARIRRDLAKVAQTRAERGLAPPSDSDRASADVAQAEAQVTDLDSQLRTARRQLLLLVGDATAPIASLQIPAATPGQPPASPAAVPGDILQRRPDVREAEARLRVAIAQSSIDRLALFPTFTLRPGAGLSRIDQPSFSSTSASWTLGVGVNVPVLNRRGLLQTMHVSDARAEEAAINYEKVVQTAYAEAENALNALAADEDRVRILTDGEVRARRAYDASRIRYGAGLEDLSTTLSTEQSWRATRIALIGAQVQALRRSVQTFKALGGGWTMPNLGSAA
jgi:multidrug efflux system outer membrane protein